MITGRDIYRYTIHYWRWSNQDYLVSNIHCHLLMKAWTSSMTTLSLSPLKSSSSPSISCSKVMLPSQGILLTVARI